YYIIPRIYNRPLHSLKLANFHFWIGTIGIVFYAIPMYWGGITQSLMWKQFTKEGALLYPNFLDTVTQIIPMYVMRSIGGTMYLTGFIVMAYNMLKTIQAGKLQPGEQASAPSLKDDTSAGHEAPGKFRHRILERKPLVFTGLTLVAVLVGGIIEFVPVAMVRSNIPTIASVKPYTPLELEGRDIYIREGCNTCHSQMIRPFRSETERYGEYSKAGEFVYDHPFLWGSKRTGPDLHRVGGKYNHAWHFQHMKDPRITSPGSIMPKYPWLFDNALDTSLTTGKIRALSKIGVDYPAHYDKQALTDLNVQAAQIAEVLKKDGMPIEANREIVAVIAYLQRLGTDIKAQKAELK
ncbi:MAG TPA: cytochrome-c oxidase, cbb3-type subunit II, partial [Turneriella sp.]|nr:cytochrome-c oxidase, cbb3-type subunit II [Turneriella sp.]